MLSIDHQSARSAAFKELPPLGFIASPRLTERVMSACARRANSEKPGWLDSVDTEVFKGLPKSIGLLESIATNLWSATESSDPAGMPAVEVALSSIRRLADAIEWVPPSKLTEAVLASATVRSIDEPELNAWRRHLHLALAFESRGLLAPADWRPHFVQSAVELAETPTPNDSLRALIRSILLDDSPTLISASSLDTAMQLFNAVEGAPTLRACDRCLIRARIAAARPRDAECLSLAPQEFVGALEQVRDDGESDVLSDAIGTWLGTGAASTEQAWEVVGRYIDGRLPEALKRGLREYANRLSPSGRTALAQAAFKDFPDRIASEELLETIHFHEGDLGAKIALLIGLAGRATNDEGRRGLFRIWSALRLTNRELIRQLVDGIMIPLIEEDPAGRDLALANLQLVQNLAEQDKGRLSHAIMESAGAESDEWRTGAARLLEAGVMKEGGNILTGRRPEHRG